MKHVQDMAKLDRDMQLQVMLDSLEVFEPRREDQLADSERSCETTYFRCPRPTARMVVANVREQ